MTDTKGKLEVTEGDVKFVVEYLNTGSRKNPMHVVRVIGYTPDVAVSRMEDVEMLRLLLTRDPGEDLRAAALRMHKPEILQLIAHEQHKQSA